MNFKESIKKLLRILFDKNAIAPGLIVSILLTYALVVGTHCHKEIKFFNPIEIVYFVIFFVGFYVLSVLLWTAIKYLSEKKLNDNNAGKTHSSYISFFLVSAGLLFLSWIPCFLASFPGFFTYDAGKEFCQIYYNDLPIQSRFPIIHSIILLVSCKLGLKLFDSLNVGIAFFSLIHMLLGAFVLAYETVFVYKYTNKKWMYILSVLYYMFCPTIVLFAGCSNSTVFGSLLASMLLMRFYEIFIIEKDSNQKKSIIIKNIIEFLILAILTCHIRTSFTSLYACLLILQFSIKKNIIRRTIIFVLGFALVFSFNKVMTKAFNAESAPQTELASVPAQQLSMVYVREGKEAFDEKELNLLYEYFSESHFDFFSPWIADPIKLGMNEEYYSKHKKDFYLLWIKKGFRYPKDYLEAWNYLTYQAWYPLCEPDGYIRRNYIESDYSSDYFKTNLEAPAEHVDLIPGLYKIAEWFSTEAKIHSIPIVGQICTLGYQYFFLVFALGYLWFSRSKKIALILGTELFYFMVCLFAPLVLIRYYLLVFYMFPVVTAAVFGKIQSKKV